MRRVMRCCDGWQKKARGEEITAHSVRGLPIYGSVADDSTGECVVEMLEPLVPYASVRWCEATFGDGNPPS
jgi:hypothetical protein